MPLAPWLLARVLLLFVFVFDMSLRLLARWFLHVSSRVAFFETALIPGVDAVTFDARNCYLAGLLPLLWSPGCDFSSLGAPWKAKGA